MRYFGALICAVLLLIALARDVFANEIVRKPAQLDVLDIRDMDIRDTLKFIAQKSGLNIVVGDAIQGRVTVYFENVDAYEALSTILMSNQLAYEESGGLLRVIPAAEFESRYGRPFSQKIVSRLISLQGMKAAAAAALLEKMRSPLGKVIADESSRTVLIEDTPEALHKMQDYLQAIDRPLVSRALGLRFIDVDKAAEVVNEMLTLHIGELRVERDSAQLFLTDRAETVARIEAVLRQIDVPRTPVVIALSYAKAEEVAAIIKSFLTARTGLLEVDKRSNQLIITDAPARIIEIEQMVRQLDRQEPEVLIEARIVQVVLKDEFRMGIDWEAVVANAHGLKLSSVWGGVGAGGKGMAAIGTLSDDNYRAVIEALGSANRSHILSNPRVAVVNREEARILVGSTKPYVTTSTTTPSAGPVTIAEEVKFIDVGVKLVVSPVVHKDGFITMKIRPEVSSAASSLKTGQNNLIPIVETSEVETTVRVKDGVTIMIGGLIKDEALRGDSKVPVLGDVPIVGTAFRSRSKGKEKNEIVIFLTPRIISGGLEAKETKEQDFGSGEKRLVL